MPPNSGPALLGDARALRMATPLAAARRLAARLPPGRALELCCGVGGLTMALARHRRVVAIDQNPARLAQAQANLAAHGLADNVDLLCCDLRRPALEPRPGLFRLVVMDPDWAAAGDPPENWANNLERMQPRADELIRWAQGFRCTLIMRLPPGLPQGELIQYGYFHTLSHRDQGREKFVWVIWGN